ncbi:MAG: VOC family protein [Ignavibacteriae bacterium]|nr:VOC family protein [Ignavibacteriota bacterium]
MQKIVPFIWLEKGAEEAAEFYCSVFKDGKITSKSYYGENAMMPKGTLMAVNFTINGQDFSVLNGGPYYKITPAISFLIKCKNQEEIDYFWEKLTENGGKEVQCGWLEDKFGVTWQVVPENIDKYFCDTPNYKMVMDVLFKMKKLEIAVLEKAFKGE